LAQNHALHARRLPFLVQLPYLRQACRGDLRCRALVCLLARHDAFVGESLAGMAKKLGLLRGWLEGLDIDPFSGR
jgi:hypothetical protein